MTPIISRAAMALAATATFMAISAPAENFLTLTPEFASVHTYRTKQFKATESGVSDAAITWQVNGVTGGSSGTGTISKEGLYSAPGSVPVGTTVTVSALATGVEAVSATVALTTGVIFYVATTGKNTNSGSLSEPWKTIQHAANTAIAGDTVYVRKGTYHESVNLPHSGSASAGSIIFASYPGELAIVDGTGVACCGDSIQGLFNIVGNESYLILEGMEIQNYASNNVDNEPADIYVSESGEYIGVLNNTMHGIVETAGSNGNAHGIGFYGTAGTPLSHVTVSGNNVYGLKTGNSETIIFDGNVVGFTVTGNVVHDTNNIGIDATGFYQTGPSGHDQARSGVIAGNTVYNISSLHNPAYNGYGADGIYCDGCTEVIVARNLVYNCDLNIETASENPHHDTSYVTVRDNLVYGGNLAGISIGGYSSSVGGSDHITIVNNTLFNNNVQDGGGEFQVQFHAIDNVFENNIVYAGAQGVLVYSYTTSEPEPVTVDYNLYFTEAQPQWWWQNSEKTSFGKYQTASGQDKHSHFENPGLISVKSPYNFNLTATSPAREAGDFRLGSGDYGTLDFAGDARTLGSTVDIGAYE